MPHWVTASTSDSPALRYAGATASLRPVDPVPVPPACGLLPQARKVLAVIARPGQESANLGALLYAFRRAGASLALLSVTRGEASPLNSTLECLETRRPWELQVAAALLGVSSVSVADYPDGGLDRRPLAELTELVRREIRRQAPDQLQVVDPVADCLDDAVVARAVRCAARLARVPVMARAEPGTHGGQPVDLGADPAVARAVQRSAAAAHASQSEARPEVERRLALLNDRETIRWLVPAPRRA